MSFLKFAAKAVGSVTLATAGLAAGIVKRAADASGADGLSDIIGSVQDASYRGAKGLWSESDEPTDEDPVAALRRSRSSKIQAAEQVKRMADIAKSNGDMDKYDSYMERYQALREQCRELEAEIQEYKE
ncbi:MAG: hypothetical protein E7475_02760 [Ruminococcaceae bacterium]|nr:hypothetical protein [Oscillospiraceae bacterium]